MVRHGKIWSAQCASELADQFFVTSLTISACSGLSHHLFRSTPSAQAFIPFTFSKSVYSVKFDHVYVMSAPSICRYQTEFDILSLQQKRKRDHHWCTLRNRHIYQHHNLFSCACFTQAACTFEEKFRLRAWTFQWMKCDMLVLCSGDGDHIKKECPISIGTHFLHLSFRAASSIKSEPNKTETIVASTFHTLRSSSRNTTTFFGINRFAVKCFVRIDSVYVSRCLAFRTSLDPTVGQRYCKTVNKELLRKQQCQWHGMERFAINNSHRANVDVRFTCRMSDHHWWISLRSDTIA